MKLDSDEQRKLLIELLKQGRFTVTFEELLAGPSPEVVALIQAIQDAEIL